MEKVKLSEVCEVVTGSTPKSNVQEFWNGNLKWLTPAELDDNSFIVYDTERKITFEGAKATGLKPFPEGTVILSSRAPIGKVAISGCEMYCNQGFKNLICSSRIYNIYLFWFLKSKTQFLNNLGRGATFKEISKAIVENIEVPLPSYNQQECIVEQLNEIQKLIMLYREQHDLLERLVKSRFIEMFGTLERPSKSFQYDELGNLCRKITDGKHGGCTQEEGSSRYFIGAREIFNDKVNYESAVEINKEEFEKDYKRCNVEIGDLLIVNTGATIGKSAIANDVRTTRTLLQKSVALIKTNTLVLNTVFLQYCYKVNDRMYKVTGASAQPNLLLSKIKTTIIYVPPIELQNQFADFVAQVEKSKLAVQQSLNELETLKKALMQQYFG